MGAPPSFVERTKQDEDDPMAREMTDREIADEIAARRLEEEYLRELLASMGHDPAEGWTDAAIAAIENAAPDTRRRAALRTLALGD